MDFFQNEKRRCNISKSTKYSIGIDLGGTKIESAILDADLECIYRERVATPKADSADAVFSRIQQEYQRAVNYIKAADHSLGLGTPGSINPDTKLLRNSSIASTNGIDFEKTLESYLKHPVAVANDAQCFALAEARLGAGKKHQRVFGVILGTGVGGALVESGNIVQGRNGILGEWGHTSLDNNHHQTCRCGRNGCVESILGGGSIQQRYQTQEYELSPTAETILKSMPDELHAWYYYYGLAMANLIQTLDPDCIVLGGGLSQLPDIHSTGLRYIQHHIFSDVLATEIYSAELGPSAGSLGAALLGAIAQA